mmetsp:Transcript_9780/g.14740  ORF Transcript_9780/g.14740 Transcript_9780/m.14740 type:complete len:255 (-) Transcript_9780:408-1172(-)
MGSSSSILLDPHISHNCQQYIQNGLTVPSINQLYYHFQSYGYDSNRNVSIHSILTPIGRNNCQITHKIFSMYDYHNTSKISFRDYMLIIWEICSLETKLMASFVFMLYDDTASDVLSIKTVRQMLADICGADYIYDPNASALLSLLKLNGDNGLNVKFFQEFTSTHPQLLSTLGLLQTKLCNHTLGVKIWQNVKAHRSRICGTQYVPASVILKTGRSTHQEVNSFLRKHPQIECAAKRDEKLPVAYSVTPEYER